LRVLLDECVDARFAPHIAGFETHTVLGKGWSGVSNGRLLALAQTEFSIAVILIHCKSNRIQPGRQAAQA
jgi:hypothetical protein